MSLCIILVYQDELIGDHTHLLKGNRLSLSSGESFDDPALLVRFHELDLLLNELDDDLVLDVTVCF